MPKREPRGNWRIHRAIDLRSFSILCGANERAAHATTMKRLSTSAPKFRTDCMAKPSGGSVEQSGWDTTSVSLQLIGGRLAAPLDSSSTLGGGWGDVSGCLSVSITADASVVPPPRRLTFYSARRRLHHTSVRKFSDRVGIAASRDCSLLAMTSIGAV